MNNYNPYAVNPNAKANPSHNQQGFLTQDQRVKLQREAFGFTKEQSKAGQQAQNMTPSIFGRIKQYNY
ncbi:hypothetical protein [Acinetobacter nosocomialis]|uniref:hypothetical protein n=1 Tax=Acinetobacter nosocomialis TaxID=106654 RepID=UPI0034CF9F64